MDLTPSSLNALRTQYSQIFQEAFLAQEIMYSKIAQTVMSKSESETHVWMDRIPQLRQWIGDRIIQNAVLQDYVLTNLPFELTMGLDEFRIKDNKIAAFDPTVRMMAEQAKKWPDTLLFTATTGALAAGSTVLTYDGQAFFSTAHPVNTYNASLGTQSNYAASGKALTYSNYGLARQQMRAYKGADNLPLKVNPTLLVVPPALETTAIQILHDELIAPGSTFYAGAANTTQSNPFKGTADYLVVDDLAGQDTTWYLLDTSKSIKPFLFQLREPAKFVMKVKPDDPAIFSRHEVQYGTSVRGAMGYGPWFFASSWTA